MGPPAAAAEAEAAAGAAASITGPLWSLTEEYASLDAPALEADLAEAARLVDRLATLCDERVAPHLAAAVTMTVEEARSLTLLDALVEADALRWASTTLLSNVGTYASCVASVDGTNDVAKKLVARVSERRSDASRAVKAADLFLDAATEDVVAAFLGSNDATAASTFLRGHSRRMREHTLPLNEEQMLTSYSVPGITAWGALYTDLSRTLTVSLDSGDGADGAVRKTMGVAAAAGLLDSPDAATRRRAWHGIRDAWLPHTEACAAILNALTAWRAETARRRRLGHFLDTPLHQNRMSRPTLDALFGAVDARGTAVGRRALAIQAAALGVPVMQPWDLLAPAPVRDGGAAAAAAAEYPFDEGIELIAQAVGRIDAEAGAFVRMMRERGWIEASRGDDKQPGAYCTGFLKSRSPRVYLSEYNGRSALLLTTAHELGHAWHSWVMREMPVPETQYPMNLAETASIFFETVVAAELMHRAATAEERFAIQWGNAESAVAFFLNIPARFTFECALNEKRAAGKLSPAEMDATMVDAWRHHYGDALGSTDLTGIFYASKLHFHLSGLAFYNFPYTFGYLFALGVYSQRDKAASPAAFADAYRGLLRDTGRMTAEEVVAKHLGGADITQQGFWLDAIATVEGQVEALAATAAQLGYPTPAAAPSAS